MKFVDEARITVQAGHGGSGVVHFRREKFVPRGGPDGGDGGDGGHVYLVVDEGLNTLIDFRHTHHFAAGSGASGSGANRSGARGPDCWIRVPVGTRVFDEDTRELIGDLTRHEQTLIVAQGGHHGLGNTRFKSSVNQAPRRATAGTAGERRALGLELQLLADVGLLGEPNVGKSSLLRALSAARPKVADYPFTTLYPQLGVVVVGPARSFTLADIPGLIAGAAEGVGLGTHFLRHLARTRLLLHVIDMAPNEAMSGLADPAVVLRELGAYDPALAERPRWIVLNKSDLVPPDDIEAAEAVVRRELDWDGPLFVVSAVSGAGLNELAEAVMTDLEQHSEAVDGDAAKTG